MVSPAVDNTSMNSGVNTPSPQAEGEDHTNPAIRFSQWWFRDFGRLRHTAEVHHSKYAASWTRKAKAELVLGVRVNSNYNNKSEEPKAKSAPKSNIL